MKSARHLGPEKVVAIDRFPERLEMARTECGAETLNYEETDIPEALHNMTGDGAPIPASMPSGWKPTEPAWKRHMTR